MITAAAGLGDLLGGLFGGGPGIANPGGSLGGLGGLLGGAAAGGVLSGALGNLIKDLQNSGHGRVVQSWIGNGPNEAITPNNLEAALGSDTIDAISKQTGMGFAGLHRSAHTGGSAADRSRSIPDGLTRVRRRSRRSTLAARRQYTTK